MAGVRIELTHETGKAVDFLRRLAERVDDLSPLFGQIGDHLIESTAGRFYAGVDPDGNPWEPLSERYRRRKRKNADRILVLEGDLRDTLAYNVSPRELEFGTGRVYGATHQFGRDAIPARPYLGVSDEDEVEILLLMREFIETSL